MDKGNDKSEDIGPLPPSKFSLRRTEGEGTGNSTLAAGYEWHFTCDLQPRRRMPAVESIYLLPKQIFFLTGQWSLVNQNERMYCSYTIHLLESGFYIDILFIST